MPERTQLDLQQAARDHLWLHFTRMGGYADAEMPIIVRGDGCYLEDSTASATSTRSPGCSRCRSATATARRWARRRPRRCASCRSTRTGRTPTRARSSSPRDGVARAGRPEPRVLRLRRLRGGRVGVEARAPVPRARAASAAGRRSRGALAYHGTTMGALSINGIPALRAPFEPLVPGVDPRAQHEPLPPPAGGDRGGVHARSCSTTSSRRSIQAGPGDGRDGDHGAGAERRRRVHAAGRLLRRACARSATATASCSAPTR